MPATGPAAEALARTGEVLTAPARLDKESALWLGGIAAGGLLVYSSDTQIRSLYAKNHSPLNDDLAKVYENFGNGATEAALIGGYAGLTALLHKPEGPRTSLLAAEAFVAANAAGTLVKLAAGRARPYAHLGKGTFRPFKLKTAYTSFPSGHTTSAFAVASVFAGRWESRWAGAAVYLLASGTAFERVYDDKHWASDVFAGAVLGTVTGRYIVSLEKKGSKPSALLLPVYAPGYSGAAAVFTF